MASERHKEKYKVQFFCALIMLFGTQVVSGCLEGYFGYNCLYKNVFHYRSYNIRELADANYDTCVPSATSLTITFNLTRVLFIRLIVKDNSQYKNIGFTFQTKDLCKTCNGSFLLTETNIVEYHCLCLVTADGLTISNIEGKPVCHLEVTEGRNMVAQSTIDALPVSPETPFYSFFGLTDGITGTNSKSCYMTIAPGHFNNVTTTFQTPVFVNLIELYDMSPDFHSLNNAELALVDTADNPIWTLTITGSQEIRRFINDIPSEEVHKINIKKFKFIAICEMRFFGDCPAGKYGVNCTENCNKGCAHGSSCDITGRCKFGCSPGYYKIDCSMECNENCGQDGSCDSNGICNFGCQQGYYGDRCTEMRTDFRTILDLSEPRYTTVCKQGLIENDEFYSLAARVTVDKISLTRRNILCFEILHKSSLYFKPLCCIQLNSPCDVSQTSRECYCKNNTNGVMEVILNKTAELSESEALIRVSSFMCGIWNYSNNVTLPVIYGSEEAILYIGFYQLNLSNCRVTLKSNDVLRWCVHNLLSYSVALSFSYARSTSSLDCLEHFFVYEPSPGTRDFNVSYRENEGCMRSKSYTCLWYYKQEKKSTNGLNTHVMMSNGWNYLLKTLSFSIVALYISNWINSKSLITDVWIVLVMTCIEKFMEEFLLPQFS